MNADLLAQAYSAIGFPFYAINLGDLVSFLRHPQALEGCHHAVAIEGVLPERQEAVATALGRIVQQIAVAPGYSKHFASGHMIAGDIGLVETFRTLTANPNPPYQMSVLPERIYWEEISPWPAAYSTFLGQLGELVRVFGSIVKKRCGELPSVRILDNTSRVLPTRFHYAAASLGAWGGGACNLQFLAYLVLSESIAAREQNESVMAGLGYDPTTARALSDSGLIAIPEEVVRGIYEIQGDDTVFGGTPINEGNTANMPGVDLDAEERGGYLMDKYYRSSPSTGTQSCCADSD